MYILSRVPTDERWYCFSLPSLRAPWSSLCYSLWLRAAGSHLCCQSCCWLTWRLLPSLSLRLKDESERTWSTQGRLLAEILGSQGDQGDRGEINWGSCGLRSWDILTRLHLQSDDAREVKVISMTKHQLCTPLHFSSLGAWCFLQLSEHKKLIICTVLFLTVFPTLRDICFR